MHNMSEFDLWYKNVGTKEKELLTNLTLDEKNSCFAADLKFGTGGVRAKLGLGNSRLNQYTIEKIARGYVNYLIENKLTKLVVIGYDARFYSKEFAKITAKVLADNGIKYMVFDDLVATPIVSYLIKKFNASGGVMITASHNPSDYNGYKIYNQDGAQLNLQQAKDVSGYINDLAISFKQLDVLDIKFNDIQILDDYINFVANLVEPGAKNLKILFSPVNSTSYKIMPEILKSSGFLNVDLVTTQSFVDPNFNNAKSINPEDSDAYIYALAEVNNHDLIIVSDPDADRLGIMIKTKTGYIPLSGNQVGSLLIDYILAKTDLSKFSNPTIYNTIVTGELGAIIARSYGVDVISTLTGFKFIGERISQDLDRDFLFGYEESYGYLLNSNVLDKDAFQAAVIICEMCNYYLNQNITLDMKYEQLSQKHGYYIEKTISYNVADMQTITAIIEDFKKIDKIANHEVSKTINYMVDDTGLPKENVIKKFFNGSNWLVVRPSGTEPKIKFYICISSDKSSKNEVLFNQIKDLINKLVQ